MKNSFIIYIFLITAMGLSVSAKSQEQKKPSERSFSQEISRIKQIQKQRTKLVEQTKAQTTENPISPGTGSVPVITANQNSTKVESAQGTKPSLGGMRKPKKPISPKVD